LGCQVTALVQKDAEETGCKENMSVVEEGWRNWANRSHRRVKTGWKWEFEFTLVAVVQCRQL